MKHGDLYIKINFKDVKIFDDLVFNAIKGVIRKPKIYIRKTFKQRQQPALRLYDEIRPDLKWGESLQLRPRGEWYNHDFNDDNHCAVCGKPIRQRKKGRKKIYCSNACKQFAKRQMDYKGSFVPIEQQTSTFNMLGHLSDDYWRTKLLENPNFLDKWGVDDVTPLRNDEYWGVGTGLLLSKPLKDKQKEAKAIKKELRRIRKMPKP